MRQRKDRRLTTTSEETGSGFNLQLLQQNSNNATKSTCSVRHNQSWRKSRQHLDRRTWKAQRWLLHTFRALSVHHQQKSDTPLYLNFKQTVVQSDVSMNKLLMSQTWWSSFFFILHPRPTHYLMLNCQLNFHALTVERATNLPLHLLFIWPSLRDT